MSQPLAADLVTDHTFYYADGKGRFFRSMDGGRSYALMNADLVKTESLWSVRAVPNVADEVWVGYAWRGLFRSTDGGKTFTKVKGVADVHAFAFGRPYSGEETSLFLYGSVLVNDKEIFGVWRSGDRGATFDRIDVPNVAIGNVGWDGQIATNVVLTASRQTPGTVFIGTGGRGIYVGSASP